ncbi:unnamed protein product [Strongylus vulgaris]|uniref:Uncharacterized protein n=1 Tax=Strongylus vulgaris TaxID=40348 RepID=A0A3P7LIV2_STRVU|nr:unnamed protein product [Strongylus vulgaris]
MSLGTILNEPLSSYQKAIRELTYVFDCLDDCECDTDDEVVHCHNGNRKELALPKGIALPIFLTRDKRTFRLGQRLRGFPVIGMTYNDLHRLPDEATLITKFPDLKVIDVERNPNFDCDSLKEYDRVKIVSDCYKNVSEVSKVPRIFRPTRKRKIITPTRFAPETHGKLQPIDPL